jgi:hypothetical protein
MLLASGKANWLGGPKNNSPYLLLDPYGGFTYDSNLPLYRICHSNTTDPSL